MPEEDSEDEIIESKVIVEQSNIVAPVNTQANLKAMPTTKNMTKPMAAS